MGGHDVRRWLSGLLGVAVFVAMGTGAAFAAPAGNGDDNVQNRGGGGELEYQDTIDLAYEDIQAFWEETLPDIYELEYREIPEENFLAYDEDTDPDDLPACGDENVTYEDVADNAFYCVLGAEEGEDFVAYDDGSLFPRLFEDFGPFALVQVLAHEWGHAIQGQTLTFDEFVNAPSIQKELQADCFAGAYVAWVDEGDSEAFVTEPGDLETGLAGMLEFADPLGVDPTEQGAHGNGFDRTNAFSEGFESGATRCAEYDDLSLLPPVTEIPFTTEEDLANEGDLPIDEAIEFGIEDLDLYWSVVFEVSDLVYDGIEEGIESFDPRRKSTLPECEGLDLKPRRPRDYRGAVFYCPGEEFIAYDENVIEDAHGDIGDFAAMLLIGNAWAAGMQEDLELEGGPAQVDCFSGSYAGSIPIEIDGDGIADFSANGNEVVRDPDPPTGDPLAAILLSPGDLDEVVQSFLLFSEPAAGNDPDQLTAYDRLQFFRQGFFSGEEECSAIEE
jgi:predicted metalloprotease